MSLLANVDMCLGQVVDGEHARDNAVLIGVPHYGDIRYLINLIGICK